MNFTTNKFSSMPLIIVLLLCGFLLNLGLWQYAKCAPTYEISGYYLGATPENFSITIEIDPESEEKYFEVETGGVRLFFIKLEDTLRLYRIVKEQAITSNKVRSVLDNLKARYGTPDKQQVKTTSVRPRNKASYTTTVRNKAIWNISETQEFVAEVESKRVVYELLDHDPESIKSPQNAETAENGGTSTEGWNPDY